MVAIVENPNFLLDSDPPTPFCVRPGAPSIRHAGYNDTHPSILVDGLVSGASVTLTETGPGGPVSIPSVTGTVDRYGTALVMPTAALPDGTYTLSATQTLPSQGQTLISPASATEEVIVDTSAPSELSCTDNHSETIDGRTNATTPDCTARPNHVDTDNGYMKVAFFLDGHMVGDPGWGQITLPTLADGEHTVTAFTVDDAGHTGSRSAAVTFTVDTVRPAVPTIVSPQEGANITTNDPSVLVHTEPGATVQGWFSEGGGGTVTADENGNATVTLGSPWTFYEDQTAYLSVEIWVIDAAGNWSMNSASVDFTITNPAPTPWPDTGHADATAATVTGTVNPMGQSTRYHVDYALADSSWCDDAPAATAGPASTADATLPFADTRDHDVSVNLTGLAAGSDYCARLVAANKFGVGYGGFIQFTTPDRPSISIVLPGDGSGTVTGGGINCPGSCSAAGDEGSRITLTATAAKGSSFVGWGGACTGKSLCQVTLRSGGQTVGATFTKNPKPVPPKPPHVTVRVTKKGKTVTVAVTLAKGAAGTVTVSAGNGKARAAIRRSGQRYIFTAAKRGRWKITVRFTGKTGWSNQTVTRTISV